MHKESQTKLQHMTHTLSRTRDGRQLEAFTTKIVKSISQSVSLRKSSTNRESVEQSVNHKSFAIAIYHFSGLGHIPFGGSPSRLLPSDFYRLDKIRLRQIPAGHFSFAFITVETNSGKIFRA